MFIDKAVITVRAGNGGDGFVSFHREKYVANGGPDGGDGGRGGNVIFVVDTNVNTLLDFKHNKKYLAENGQNGGRRNCSGKYGEHLIVKVPMGTVVKEFDTGRILADLSSFEPVVIARGGRGGAGNQHFATATRQIPRYAKPGRKGEEFKLSLELKLLADVGLVGFPNVGKSTLISVVSAAKPTIANYHFTTLTPVLGVVKHGEKNFVMADIPGLIEGASDGIGLGHEFLRHVERCRLIVHVVDVSGIEGREPISDFEIINRELANFSMDLSERPQIVAANKADMASEEQIQAFREYIESKGYKFFTISAATTKGVFELINEVSATIDTLPPVKQFEAEPISVQEMRDRELKERTDFDIVVENGVYYVNAEFLERLILSIDMEDYESLQYFQRTLRNTGIIDKLEALGIKEGDTVNIFDFEFDFVY